MEVFFGSLIYVLWRRRNASRISFVDAVEKAWNTGHSYSYSLAIKDFGVHLGWREKLAYYRISLNHGEIALNCDGSVIRDENGIFITSFAALNCGCSMLAAEYGEFPMV